MNSLSSNWVNDVMTKRVELEATPTPFVTPPLFDSIMYLKGEIAELEMAFHKATRKGDLRNSNSTRGEVAEEVGDSLFMLATVASQAGQELRSYSYFRGNPFPDTKRPADRDLLDTCVIMSSLCTELYDELDINGELPLPSAISDVLNDLYSNLEKLAFWCEIDMAGALAGTSTKFAKRAGLL